MNTPAVPPPPVEIRVTRVAVIVILITATCIAGVLLLRMPVLADNKTEVGLVLGWLIAKSGTAVDWLLGGSEGGSRRADAQPTHNAPTGTETDPVNVVEQPK
jgi:hypothetical protein